MKLSELRRCPFCGGEQFYTHNYMYGSHSYRQRFDGGEAENNEDMYDGLTVIPGAKAYCDECNRYIGNLTIDRVGNLAEKALAERSK